MKYTIVTDSSCDLFAHSLTSPNFRLVTVPLQLTVGDTEQTDDDSLDTFALISAMRSSRTAIRSACPSPEAFEAAMRDDSQAVFCVTLSSKLSGAFQSATIAAGAITDKPVFAIDSRTTSAGLALAIMHLASLIDSTDTLSAQQIADQLDTFCAELRTRFVLQSFDNMIKSGRMSFIAGVLASVLSIRPICGDNGNGEIKMHKKVVGSRNAIRTLSSLPTENTPIVISHCNNTADAEQLRDMLNVRGLDMITILPMRGVASCYASDRGICIAF